MTDTKKQKLREIATNMMPEPVVTLGYMEHQVDLACQLIIDIASTVNLSPEAQERLNQLKAIMMYSSIDFENMTDAFQAYKVPKTVETKAQTRKVQDLYLEAQLRQGLLGN